ncbi:MAG: zinc ribbon domain-containing protein [Elusimicrobiota bacterium]
MMSLIKCPECNFKIGSQAVSCPKCGYTRNNSRETEIPGAGRRHGFEWKSRQHICGWPLIHIAFGKDKQTGKLLIAKGVVAIGQFAVGLITIAQFGIGFGQFNTGIIAVGQGALGIYLGLGQLATGVTAIGQFA